MDADGNTDAPFTGAPASDGDVEISAPVQHTAGEETPSTQATQPPAASDTAGPAPPKNALSVDYDALRLETRSRAHANLCAFQQIFARLDAEFQFEAVSDQEYAAKISRRGRSVVYIRIVLTNSSWIISDGSGNRLIRHAHIDGANRRMSPDSIQLEAVAHILLDLCSKVQPDEDSANEPQSGDEASA